MVEERSRLVRLEHNLRQRAAICELLRNFFKQQGFLEVETPVRVANVAPELYIIPFKSEGWFLSTSPELHMKRMLAAGYDRIFQISRCFRKGERGQWHNPEFTMLEWYRVNADYRRMIRDVEQLILDLSTKLGMGSVISYRGQDINVSLPWPQTTVRDAFLHAAGWDPIAEPNSLKFDTDLVSKVIPSFTCGRPTVLIDYPASLASLARLKAGAVDIAERSEVFIGGLEIANVYSELIDIREQELRFNRELAEIRKERGQRMTIPRQFLEAVAYLPECGGVALGIDRLVMLLLNVGSIDDVMPFTVDTA